MASGSSLVLCLVFHFWLALQSIHLLLLQLNVPRKERRKEESVTPKEGTSTGNSSSSFNGSAGWARQTFTERMRKRKRKRGPNQISSEWNHTLVLKVLSTGRAPGSLARWKTSKQLKVTWYGKSKRETSAIENLQIDLITAYGAATRRTTATRPNQTKQKKEVESSLDNNNRSWQTEIVLLKLKSLMWSGEPQQNLAS